MDRPRVPGRSLALALAGWAAAGGALYGVLLLVGRVLARSFYRAHSGDFGAAFLLAAYILLFGALWLAFGGVAGLRDRLGFRLSSPWHLLLAPPLWIVTVLAGAALSQPFTRWLGPPRSNAGAIVRASQDPLAAVLLVLSVTLVAPACEELLFRGALFGWLRGRVAVPLAALGSAAVFAAAHLFPSGFVLLFVFGLSAAWYYERTGSTLNTFVMHACQNTAAVVALYSGIVNPR